MGKVSERILSEAEEKKKRAIQAAKKEAKEILEKASQKAEEIKKNGEKEAEAVKKKEIERKLSQLRMALKTSKLKAKNEIVDELKKRTEKKLKQLDWNSEYKPFIEDLILEISDSKDEDIIPGTLFEENVKTLVKSFNKNKEYNFKISEGKADFEVGMILKKDKKLINASFQVLLEEAMDELQEYIVKLLFGSE